MHPTRFQRDRSWTFIFMGESIFTKFFKRIWLQQTSDSLQVNAITLYYTSQNAYNMKLKLSWRS